MSSWRQRDRRDAVLPAREVERAAPPPRRPSRTRMVPILSRVPLWLASAWASCSAVMRPSAMSRSPSLPIRCTTRSSPFPAPRAGAGAGGSPCPAGGVSGAGRPAVVGGSGAGGGTTGGVATSAATRIRARRAGPRRRECADRRGAARGARARRARAGGGRGRGRRLRRPLGARRLDGSTVSGLDASDHVRVLVGIPELA